MENAAINRAAGKRTRAHARPLDSDAHRDRSETTPYVSLSFGVFEKMASTMTLGVSSTLAMGSLRASFAARPHRASVMARPAVAARSSAAMPGMSAARGVSLKVKATPESKADASSSESLARVVGVDSAPVATAASAPATTPKKLVVPALVFAAAVAAMAPAGPAAAAAAAAVATVNAADTAWILVSTGTSSHRDVRTVGLVRRKPRGHPFGFVSFPRRLNPRYLSLRRTPNDR